MKSNLVGKKVISIIMFIILTLVATKVYAANDNFNTSLKASSSKVKREDTISITIGLKDIAIKSGEKGIGAYTANIKFDSSVLEYVSTSSMGKWEAPFYQNGFIVGNTKDGEVVKTTQNIGAITFKVKKDAKLGETTIELNNFSGSTAENDISTPNQSIKITIVASNSDNNDNNNDNNDNNNNDNNNSNDNNNNNNNNDNNNDNNSDNNNSNDNNNDNNDNNNNDHKNDTNSNHNTNINNEERENIASGVLPKTGQKGIILIVGIGIIIVCSIILYLKIHNINKK